MIVVPGIVTSSNGDVQSIVTVGGGLDSVVVSMIASVVEDVKAYVVLREVVDLVSRVMTVVVGGAVPVVIAIIVTVELATVD